MPYEHRYNSGVMFRNDKRPAGRKQPDFRGTIIVDGPNTRSVHRSVKASAANFGQ
jgi:hypothetical protein